MKKLILFIIILAIALIFTAFLSVNAITSDGIISIELDRTTAQVGDRINATIRVQNITPMNITTPIHFNTDVVQVIRSDGKALVPSGVKDFFEEYGNAGLTPEQALSDERDENNNLIFWGGNIFYGLHFPEIYNENGLIRLLFVGNWLHWDSPKEIINETLITVHFIAVGEGDADIRFATFHDTYYDPVAPMGVMYVRPAEHYWDFPQMMHPQTEFQPLTVTTNNEPSSSPVVFRAQNGRIINSFWVSDHIVFVDVAQRYIDGFWCTDRRKWINANVFVSMYGHDMRLLEANQTLNPRSSVNARQFGLRYIKVFVWERGTMQPLYEPFIIPLRPPTSSGGTTPGGI